MKGIKSRIHFLKILESIKVTSGAIVQMHDIESAGSVRYKISEKVQSSINEIDYKGLSFSLQCIQSQGQSF